MMHIDANDLFITTPMISVLHDTLHKWAWCGFTGGVIVGDARLGKSWATRCLGDSMPTADSEQMRIYHISFGPRDKTTIRAVYFRIASTLGAEDIRKTTTSDELQTFLFHAFAEAAMINRRRQVMLLVDEAQELSLNQLSVFAELFNDQDRVKNRLMVIFIANTQKFKPLAKILLDEENQYLRERFFHNIHRFYGIRTLDELKTCLTFFDRHWIDDKKKISIVDHFCPQMRKEGVSLVDLAETIWTTYDKQYAKPLNLKSWGMTYFQRTVSILLMDYLAHYWNNDENTILTMIEKSMAASGIRPNLRSIE
ncbi:ATP-binding protein [Cellvibrio polysaccharolyticus]|uniref:ATP-binding protein n=1 Tax=Cellvibrio polysaccharolyticus TaxID=2082724 RepID=A0A928YTZ4_9GAMM|nr:ATP-binding protein [Cellvibrio polysaccharolyticus]MBE8717509.1 ATP-binding protein [Cellvibrio polysaccharolyticus]